MTRPAPNFLRRRFDGFFKPSPATVPNKFLARLEVQTWILIYGGLLTLVLGVWVKPINPRSRIKTDS